MSEQIIWGWDYESTRRVMELLSFAGTFLVAIFGFFVFRQLRMASESLNTAKQTLVLMNDDMQTRINREAAVLSINQAVQFGLNLIPNWAKFVDACDNKKIDTDPWPLLNTSFDKSSVADLRKVDHGMKESGLKV